MRETPTIAARQFGAFTAAQALRAGWTSHSLRHAERSGRLIRVRPGVYAPPPDRPATPHDRRLADLRLRAVAASLANRRVTLGSAAAAAVFGMDLLTVPQLVCATYPRSRRGPMPGVHRHRGFQRHGHVRALGPVLLHSPARVAVDLAREFGPDAGIVAVDSALHVGLLRDHELGPMLADCTGWPGVRAARQSFGLADARAESALESLSRLRMAATGVPAPRTQVRIRDMSGRFLGRADFYWDEVGVVGEADGLRKYDGTEPLTLAQEKLRQETFERCGLIVVRWGWTDLSPFDATAVRLRSAFARGGGPLRPPRRWLAAWPHESAAIPPD